MKKTVCLILALVMVLSMAACGSEGKTEQTNPPATTTTAPPAEENKDNENTEQPEDGAKVFDITKEDTSDWVQLDLSYATYLAAENPKMSFMYNCWLEKLEEIMPGWVNITMYPSGTLLAQTDTLEGVIDGVAEIGHVDLASITELVPLTTLWSFPSTHVGGTASATGAFTEWMKIVEPEELSDVVVLACDAGSANHLMTSFDWNNVDELAGKQLRATSSLAPTVSALGATPVTVATSEIYEASRSGLIDGAYYTINATFLTGAHEFLKYATFMGMGTSIYAYVMNRDVFESMPETQQEYFMEAFNQAIWELYVPGCPPVADQHQPTLTAIANGEIICKRLSDETREEIYTRTDVLREEYIAELEAQGYDNAREAAELIDTLTAKWNEWYSEEDYEGPFFAAMEGAYDAETWNNDYGELPEIYGYTPLSQR